MGKGTSIGGVTIIVGANASPMIAEFGRAKSATHGFVGSMSSMGKASVGLNMIGSAAGTAGGGFLRLAGAAAAGGIAVAGITAVVAGVSSGLGAVGSLGAKMVEVGADSVKMAADMEQSRASFDVLTGSADKGRKAIDGLQKLAVDTPFASKDLIGYGRSLLGMGAKAEQLTPILSRLGDVAQGNSETLGRLVLQFGQVMNSGSFKKEEFNVFAEAGADVQAFAKAAGTDMAGLNQMFQRGEVGADVMVKGFNAMTSAGGRFYQMNATMSGTTLGAWNAFSEKIDLVKIKLGTAFINGFKPGAFLETLSGSFGSIDQIEGKLTGFFANTRKIFDHLAAGAMAFASTVGTRLGGAFDALNKDGTWKSLEQIADSVMVSILTGFDSIMNKLGEFRSAFKDTLLMAGQAAKLLVPDKAAGPVKLNGIVDHARQQASSMLMAPAMLVGKPVMNLLGGDKIIGQIEKTVGGFGDLFTAMGNAVGEGGRVLDSVGEYRKQLATTKNPMGGAAPNPVGLIDVGPDRMTPGAKKFLEPAMTKPPNMFAEFQRDWGFANEIARTGTPMEGNAAFTRLAEGYLGLTHDFLGNMERQLPAALAAGSQEAESAITRAMSQQDNPADRVASILEAIKGRQDRHESLLQKVVDQLKNSRTNLVSI
jgi:tape measure domain-containing protein